MTRVKTGASAVFLGLVLAAGGAAAPTTDFKALMQKEMDAWCTLDARNAAPLYAKEADRVFFDLSPLKYTGWDDYAAGFQKVVADFKSMRIQVVERRHQASSRWAMDRDLAEVRQGLAGRSRARFRAPPPSRQRRAVALQAARRV